MGKSAKAKKEKRKDFQKPKLRVGKAKPQPSNFTNTSFKARCKSVHLQSLSLWLTPPAISVVQQSLSTTPRTSASQFAYHLSLLNHKSDSQRRESLAYLTTALEADGPPQPVSSILPKIQPLILDTSPAVRTQLLKLLNTLPADNVGQNVEQLLLYTRAGMTHLSTGIQLSALDVLEWLLRTSGPQVVSAPGGWLKTLDTFTTILRWNSDSMTAHAGKVTNIASGWKANTSVTTGRSPEQINLVAKALHLLSVFFAIGLLETLNLAGLQADRSRRNFPYTHLDQYMISQHPDPFGYLNLFGNSRDEESIAYGYTSERQKVFEEKYAQVFSAGLESAKKEGGNVGREASHCAKELEKCRSRYKVTEKKENLMARLG